jgi:hypothetical protein
VFWVYASNSTRFKQAFDDIATRLELPGRDNPKADIFRIVCSWLCDERNSRWLMILDNADDASIFFPPAISKSRESNIFSKNETPFASFLPQSPNGTILITSRTKEVAVRLMDNFDNIFPVEPMKETECLALLETKLSISESTKVDATRLVKALDGISLAITQTCAYIRASPTRLIVSGYLELFLKSGQNQARLLQHEGLGDLRLDPGVPHTVLPI